MSTGISGTDGASEDGSSIFEKIADATMEVTVQPHIAPVSGGNGGSDNNREWRDNEDNDRQYVPYKKKERVIQDVIICWSDKYYFVSETIPKGAAMSK